MLQWGHDLSVMEMIGNVGVIEPPNELQWGHDLSVMEITTC